MKRIVVVGGGVVGVSCALALLEDGHTVTLVEPGPVGEGASWASCGCLAVGEVVPLSQPGILLKAPGWLLDPKGPLSLRPATALSMLPWFARFAANAQPRRMRGIAQDLARLTFAATGDFKAQMARYDIADMLIERPVIKLFEDDADKATMAAAFGLARELGCRIDEISGAEAHEIEPAIARDFEYAAILRDWSYVADCVRLVRALHEAFLTRGGMVVAQKVVGFQRAENGVAAVQLEGGELLDGDAFVLAAGTASKGLARDLGLRLPIEGLMGYWTGLSEPGLSLKHTVFHPKGGYGITPYEGQMAIAGTVEFAGLEARPNWQRADVLVERAKRVLPGLRTDKAERRMGRRPFMPDTRPVIGPSKQVPNLCFATGHGQLGVTLAATTGRLVADVVAGRPSDVDLAPYSPDRFA